MNCTNCDNRVCRIDQKSCNKESFSKSEVITQYQESGVSEIIKASADLVDNGRAGTLSRINEIAEFSMAMKYKRIGLAYCYGMEKHAKSIEKHLKEKGFNISTVSCSIGGIKQSEANSSSCIHKVSCNPLGQAEQLNIENVDLTLIIGICLGHDILLQRTLKMDFTTLVVKDRVNNHNPIAGF